MGVHIPHSHSRHKGHRHKRKHGRHGNGHHRDGSGSGSTEGQQTHEPVEETDSNTGVDMPLRTARHAKGRGSDVSDLSSTQDLLGQPKYHKSHSLPAGHFFIGEPKRSHCGKRGAIIRVVPTMGIHFGGTKLEAPPTVILQYNSPVFNLTPGSTTQGY